MINQPPIKVECENCGFGRPWPGQYAEGLEATNATLLAALQDVSRAYQEMFDVMPVAWQTYDNIVQDAIKTALG